MRTIKKAAKGTLTPKSSSVSSRMGSYGKKMKSGGKVPTTSKEMSFAALAEPKDKITAADRIAGAKKSAGMSTAKHGKMLKKQAATAIAMKKAGKAPKKAMMGATMMKKGGKMTKKCKYGCK